jgi:hypothetical protein
MREVMLTTTDNPYSPFDQYDLWKRFDVGSGYNTENYISRIARISPNMTNEEIEEENERAIDEILSFNLTGSEADYKKVTRDVD